MTVRTDAMRHPVHMTIVGTRFARHTVWRSLTSLVLYCGKTREFGRSGAERSEARLAPVAMSDYRREEPCAKRAQRSGAEQDGTTGFQGNTVCGHVRYGSTCRAVDGYGVTARAVWTIFNSSIIYHSETQENLKKGGCYDHCAGCRTRSGKGA